MVVVVEGRGEGWMGGVPPVSISPTRECLADENCAAGVELRLVLFGFVCCQFCFILLSFGLKESFCFFSSCPVLL